MEKLAFQMAVKHQTSQGSCGCSLWTEGFRSPSNYAWISFWVFNALQWSRNRMIQNWTSAFSSIMPDSQTSGSLFSLGGMKPLCATKHHLDHKDPYKSNPYPETHRRVLGGHSVVSACPVPDPEPGARHKGWSGSAVWQGAPGSGGCGSSESRPQNWGISQGFWFLVGQCQ